MKGLEGLEVWCLEGASVRLEARRPRRIDAMCAKQRMATFLNAPRAPIGPVLNVHKGSQGLTEVHREVYRGSIGRSTGVL